MKANQAEEWRTHMQNGCNFDSPLPCLLLVLQQHMILTLHSLLLHTILIVLSNTNVFSNETLIWRPYTQKLLRPLLQIHKHTFSPYSLQLYLLLVGKGLNYLFPWQRWFDAMHRRNPRMFVVINALACVVTASVFGSNRCRKEETQAHVDHRKTKGRQGPGLKGK